MKVIIAGSRSIADYKTVELAIEAAQFEIDEVVSGGATGVDRLGELWAKENEIKMTQFPAFWNIYGRAAGPIRNKEMAEYADALLGGLMELYKILIDAEYRHQNKRGGRPMVIPIPAGTIGIKKNEYLVFYSLSRRGHNPFVFWIDVWDKVEQVSAQQINTRELLSPNATVSELGRALRLIGKINN